MLKSTHTYQRNNKKHTLTITVV